MDENLQLSCADNAEIASEIEQRIEEISPDDTSSSGFIENQDYSVVESGSEHDPKLHNEVLEKLGIIKKEQNQYIQEKSMQENTKQEDDLNKPSELEKSKAKIQIEKAISQDFDKIQKMVKSGLINSVQGQNLKRKVLKNAFDKLVQTEKVKRASQPASSSTQVQNKNEVFEAFSRDNPDFFNSDGRKEVLNYLKSDNISLGQNELSKISEMIRIVEKTAIDRYLQKVSHEKTLRNSNELAKQKLTANAQRSNFNDKNLSRTFTREQIGKMNSAEFTKYEPIIMEQLKKGLIK